MRPAAALGAAFVVLWVAYASAIPPFEGQDEIWHAIYTQTLARGELPVQPRERAPGVEMFQQKEGTQPPLYYALAAPAFVGTDIETLRRSAVHNPHGSVGGPDVLDNRNLFAHPPDGSEIDGRMWLARGVSGLFGLGTVVLAYLSARLVAPTRGGVALLAGGLTAFLPGFLFVSALVSNDAAVAFFGALGLYVALRGDYGWGAGAVVGLAALTKSSGLLVGPLVLVGLGLRPDAWARVVAVAAFVGGWWYARNLALYGELTALRRHLGRDDLWSELPTAREIVLDLPGLAMSFVGLFGWFSVPMDGWAYALYGLVLAGGLAGLTKLRAMPDVSRRGLLLCLGWLLLVFAALLFSRLIFQSFHGRLLYPALTALALLWAIGMPRQLARLALAALAIGALAVPWLWIRPAYAVPAPCQAPPSAGAAAAPVELVAHQVGRVDVGPGELLPVELCWRTHERPGGPWSAFAQLVDPTGRVLAQHDGFPGGGNDATLWWRPGSLHADRHTLRVARDAPAPLVAELRVGLYDKGSGRRMPGIAPDGADTIGLGQVRLAGGIEPAAAPGPWPRFDDGLAVVGLDRERTADGWRGMVRLTTDRPIARSHTISLQLVGERGLVAQDDRQPRGGLYPTDAWRPGEVVPHAFELRAPPGRYRLLLVVYDLPEGTRVRAGAADHIVLAEE